MGFIVQPDLLLEDKAIICSNVIHCKTPACETTAQQKSCAGSTMASKHNLCVTPGDSSDHRPVLSLSPAAPQISQKWHRTHPGQKPPRGLPLRAGRQPVHGAKCNPDQRGAKGKKGKSMVTLEETRRGKGKKASLNSCREVLPDKERSQAAAL